MEPTVENSEKIRSILLKQAEISLWELGRFDEFFTFTDLFYVAGKITVTRETVAVAEQYQDAAPIIWEMMTRIDRPLCDDWNQRQFFMRLNTLIRTVKLQIEKYPNLLSPLTVERNRKKAQNVWMDKLYDSAGKMIVPEPEPSKTMEVVAIAGGPTVSPEMSPAQRLAEAMGKVADVYDAIASSITNADIERMKPMDKINALNKLSYLHANIKKFKPGTKFIKLNSSSGSREELESALLEVDGDE